MDPIPQRYKTLAYLPNGRLVCYYHRLRVCPICTVDYTFDEEFDSDELTVPDDEDDKRVSILVGSEARFDPRSDREIVGPAAQIRVTTAAAARPLSYHFCEACSLTWLVGEQGATAAHSHPSHHTLFHIYSGPSRSLVVWLDGACPGNGDNTTHAGVGVYFGPNSSYNVSQPLPAPTDNQGPATSQKAELAAAVTALRTVRRKVVPPRECLGEDGAKLRLVAVTDSTYLVDCMCEHMPNWTEEDGVLFNKKGKKIANSESFLGIRREVSELSKVGVQVVWYHVGRAENTHADRLAKAAVPVTAPSK